MSGITKRPAVTGQKQVEEFISGAPDGKGKIAQPAEPEQTSARKKAISMTVEPALLARVDRAAKRLGVSRAAAFSLALSRFADAEEKGLS